MYIKWTVFLCFCRYLAFICMKRTSCRGFKIKTKRSQPVLFFISRSTMYSSNFGNYLDHNHPIDVQIKDIYTDTVLSAWYLDLLLEAHSKGWLKTFRQKRWFTFSHCEFSIYIAYGMYISPLIRYATACGSNQDFLDRRLFLSRKLLNQGYLMEAIPE